jgi:membrane carboxypeptidase/penicillin-binding protein PbpC
MGKASDQLLAAIPWSSSFTASAPGTPRISAELTPLADAELATEARLTVTRGQNCDITAAGSWQAYQWYVDGTLVPGQTSSVYTFTTAARNTGIYTVTLVVTDADGGKRSASCRVTVTN